MQHSAFAAALPLTRIGSTGRQRLWLALGAILVSAFIVWWGGGVATRVQLGAAEVRGQNTLGLAVASLRGQLARFERLPQLLADYEDIKQLVRDPADTTFVAQMNAYLKEVNDLLDSSDLYVMLPSGDTIAASNYDTETSFVGGNFAFRPYFTDALAGGLGRFFALGTTSLKRGYYFGAPIEIETGIAGVVVVKVDIDEIEQSWRGGDYEIIVTDPEGIIFMSGRADWLFSSILELDEDRLARTHETRRYANAELTNLPIARGTFEHGREIFTVAEATQSREFLVLSEAMPEADWTVKVLLDTASARAQALTAVVLAVLIVGLAAMSAIIYLERRARLRERQQLERASHEQLERRVEERTAELAAVNTRLEAEIGERRATEDMLRKTQADLVQAGKLAALGQMSAALSHEFNQPLAAARNYAENALVFVDRGRVDDARANVARISALIDRMASISRHLRNFARRPNQRLGPVDLEHVVTDTLEIIGWRLRAEGVSVDVDLGPEPITILGGPVRLEQVLVNIISNALDAVSGSTNKRIELKARRDGEQVILTIRDHGPGIPVGLGDRIFDPFFSTKGIGKGLGLGLSISYNIITDFGGTLRAENHPGGGAVFTIIVKAAADATTAEPMTPEVAG